MDKDKSDQIKKLLSSQLQTESERHSFVTSAFFEDKLLNQIEYTGSTNVFSQHLITKVWDYGQLTDGTPAVVALLEVLKNNVGKDKYPEIDKLINAINKINISKSTSQQKEQSDVSESEKQQSTKSSGCLQRIVDHPIVAIILAFAAILSTVFGGISTFIDIKPNLIDDNVTITTDAQAIPLTQVTLSRTTDLITICTDVITNASVELELDNNGITETIFITGLNENSCVCLLRADGEINGDSTNCLPENSEVISGTIALWRNANINLRVEDALWQGDCDRLLATQDEKECIFRS